MKDSVVGDARRMLLILFGAVGLVLLCGEPTAGAGEFDVEGIRRAVGAGSGPGPADPLTAGGERGVVDCGRHGGCAAGSVGVAGDSLIA